MLPFYMAHRNHVLMRVMSIAVLVTIVAFSFAPTAFARNTYVITDGSGTEDITKEIILPDEVTAPIQKGDVIGKAVYKKSGTEI